jgi:hypothetical protein
MIKNNLLTLTKLIREVVVIMEKNQELDAFKSYASLHPECSTDAVCIHLLKQYMRIEQKQFSLWLELLKKKPKTLNIIIGEIAQSYEKSIFCDNDKVNNTNSFFNFSHLQQLTPISVENNSIPDVLCSEYNALVIDLYMIPIPTKILNAIRSDMYTSGLAQRFLAFQETHLLDLLSTLAPQEIQVVCRYKSLIPDTQKLMEAIQRNTHAFRLTFHEARALSSGSWGQMDLEKLRKFLKP